MEKTLQKQESNSLSDKDFLAKIQGITVGYDKSRTLYVALGEVGDILNQEYGVEMTPAKMQELMRNENVIDCRGLDNYFLKFHNKVKALVEQLAA